ncbi:hypothetical protein LUZ60_014855 [Juncus effusus]|nr:hypothetical protein LUZ60_014855 [Juncus effusus]
MDKLKAIKEQTDLEVLVHMWISSLNPFSIFHLFLDKIIVEGKDYCDRKINLLKSNFDELDMATKKKSIADDAGLLLQAKLRHASPST